MHATPSPPDLLYISNLVGCPDFPIVVQALVTIYKVGALPQQRRILLFRVDSTCQRPGDNAPPSASLHQMETSQD